MSEEKVWDPIVRVFHWLLVIGFVLAYASGDDWETLHTYSGYLVLGLLLLRIVWGVIGSSHARFSDFVFTPTIIKSYLKDAVQLRAKRYVGHNPAGGAMVIIMLLSLLLLSVSGLGVLAIEENAGPLLGVVDYLPSMIQSLFEPLHEFTASFTVFLIIVHVGGVIFESLLHHENLVGAMINGRKRVE